VNFVLFSSIAILVVLILISGVLSSAEIALSSANRGKVKLLVEAGNKKAERLLKTMDEPSNFFATTQLYITFIAFFSGAYAASSFTDPFLALIERTGLQVSGNVAASIAFILITALLTYVALILGELVPKRIALQYAIPFALRVIPFLNVLSIIALPFVKILSASAKGVLRLVGIKGATPEEDVTKEEIRLMVESGSSHGNIHESEHDMIENIFEFDKMTAGTICVHRLDVVALSVDSDFKSVLDLLTETNYTRIPVFEGDIDNILGILHFKDIMYFMASNADTSGFDLKTLLREPYFVPLSKRADELFQDMRADLVYMAVVIDEYGGTLGIVTMEDLVEKIVGNIQDEYDTDELPDIHTVDENTFLIQGTADLETVQEFFGVELPIDEHDTLSGFLVGQLGYIPAEDEKPEITTGSLLFKVESVQDKRVASVTVTRVEISDETDEV